MAYLNSFRKNPAVPEEFAAGITLAVAEFKKANNSAFEKIRDRLLAAAETEEERQEVLKAFEEEIGIYGSSYTNTMMVELGERLYFAAGSDKNIKLTTKDDMELFKAYLAMDKKDNYLK